MDLSSILFCVLCVHLLKFLACLSPYLSVSLLLLSAIALSRCLSETDQTTLGRRITTHLSVRFFVARHLHYSDLLTTGGFRGGFPFFFLLSPRTESSSLRSPVFSLQSVVCFRRSHIGESQRAEKIRFSVAFSSCRRRNLSLRKIWLYISNNQRESEKRV